MADEKAELAVVADTDLSGVIRRVREQMHYHTADACDLEVICAAAEQLTEARAELEQWKLHQVVRGLEAAVDDLKEESNFRAERIATLEQELEKTQRALLAANTTLSFSQQEADRLRAQLSAQGEEIAELRKSCEMACVEPADDCECCGCLYAAEVAARAALTAGAKEGER